MVMATRVFGPTQEDIHNGLAWDYPGNAIRAKLMQDAYTPDADSHHFGDDADANRVTDEGQKDQLLASKVVTIDTPNDRIELSCATITWTAVNPSPAETVGGVVMYIATVEASGTSDSGSATTLVHSARTEVDDTWNDYALKMGTGTDNGIDDLIRHITDFDQGSNTITCAAFPAAIDTDPYEIIRHAMLSSHDFTTGNLTTNGSNIEATIGAEGFYHAGYQAA